MFTRDALHTLRQPMLFPAPQRPGAERTTGLGTPDLSGAAGFYTIYSHLSAVHVAQGDRVVPGQVLGAVGDTGSLKGSCLHFEVRAQAKAEDPRRWLR